VSDCCFTPNEQFFSYIMASRADGKSCNYIRIYVTPQVILKEGMHNIKLNFTSSSEAEYGTPTLAYYPPRPA
jgi:hypothetical protein